MLSGDFRREIAQIIAMLHSAYRIERAGELSSILDQIDASVSRLRTLKPNARGQSPESTFTPGVITTTDSPPLHSIIANHIRRSSRVRIASAFLSASDTNPLILPLHELTSAGGTVQVLTSLMGFLNRPETLAAFANWGRGLSLRLYSGGANDEYRLLAEEPPAFHAKAILCEKLDGRNVMLIGSSNLTASGFQSNIEWNYLSDFEVNAPLIDGATPFERAIDLFDTAWDHHGYEPTAEFIARYGELHRRGNEARRTLSRLLHGDRATDHLQIEQQDLMAVTPRPAQQEALGRLASLRKAGVRRFAVIAATGIGKTYLSAFEARSANARRILFIAHRDLILRQAQEAFRKVLPNHAGVVVQGRETIGNVPSGLVAVFASVQTLARETNLRLFTPTEFDYVIIDEFHHAEAQSYQLLLDYLKPTHLLGMTATPERTDGQDVLRFCDRRVAYEVRLMEAISRGWLTPFHYYAIHDPTDYEPIRWTGTGYDEIQLQQALSNDTRAELIVRNLRRFQPPHGKTKAIAFCTNIGHAQWMAAAFTERGVVSVPLLGNTPPEDRRSILQRLQDEDDSLQTVCAVDVLNEGIDVPSLTHVLLLRPTQSFTVFLQQLGRGLRREPNKPFVSVLDFIGNYRKSYVAPLALQGHYSLPEKSSAWRLPLAFKPPDACLVSAEAGVERIWSEQIQLLRPLPPIERLRSVLEEIGGGGDIGEVRLPELFTIEDDDNYAGLVREQGGWLQCRLKLRIADEFERSMTGTPAENLLVHIEHELQPNRSYKFAVLKAVLELTEEDESAPTEWSVVEVAKRFLAYYLESPDRTADWPELSRSDQPGDYSIHATVKHIQRHPLHRLSNTPEKPFELSGETFALKAAYRPFWRDARFRREVGDRVAFAEARYWRRTKPTRNE